MELKSEVGANPCSAGTKNKGRKVLFLLDCCALLPLTPRRLWVAQDKCLHSLLHFLRRSVS